MTPAHSNTPAAKRVVGQRYDLLEQIGSGGMGIVWRAHDTLLQREVAVKEIRFPAGTNEDEREILRKRVFREARAAARLAHPSVVTVYDVIEEDGQPFIVMELIDAPSLTDVVRLDGPLQPARAAAVALDILSALEVAHAAGVVHRDIKPSNVMVPASGHCELADFGIASVQDDPSVTSTGLVLGSPAYMAPEQGSRGVTSPASDLWSLGATLFFAVEGTPPFEGDGALPTLSAVLHDAPREMVHGGPLTPIITGLLTKDPDRRPTHRVVRAELERVVAHAAAATPATRVESGPYPAEPRADDTLQLVRTEQLAAASVLVPAPVPQIAGPVVAGAGAGSSYPLQADRRRSGLGILAGLLLVGALIAGAVYGFGRLGNEERGSGAGVAAGGSEAAAIVPPSEPAASASPTPRASATSRAPSAAANPAVSSPTVSASAPEASATVPASSAAAAAAPASPPAVLSSAPAASPPAASPSAVTAVQPGVPADWVSYTHPTVGYTIRRPAGWTVTQKGFNTDIKDPATGAYLRVAYRTPPGADATQAWRDSEPSFRSRYPSYQRIALQPGTYRDLTNVGYWEYTYGRQRAVNLGFVLADRSYGFALNFQTPQALWAQSQPTFDAFKASFQPPA